MKKIVIATIAAAAISSVAMAAVNTHACAGCHGAHFEKHALGKSKIVANMTHAEIATALKGYKAGTFGGPMKGIMKGQVARYSDADLDAVAQTIGK
ncbi:Cytochrome C553 (soluble cytochrome f) [hydrothermal vent metagenome]|uniref:Cytochrome C553 (Soluble cytochrome f) n=1 Tax=hydrothermal vent metagenome TaxID=652676 RepID=A0A1W1BSH4_9ZZZZ